MNKRQSGIELHFQGDHIEVIRFVLHAMEDKEINNINLQRHDNNWTVELETFSSDKRATQIPAGLFDMGW